jgi:tetratricopeptide (TPR) repeat protein
MEDLACPKCVGPMRFSGEPRGPIATCYDCWGIWIDTPYLTTLKEKYPVGNTLFQATGQLQPGEAEPTDLLCPSCSDGKLVQQKIHGVELEWCESCHGIYLDRGEAYRSSGQSERALADLDKAVELMPGDTGPLFQRAQLRYETEDLQGAIKDCRVSIRLKPADWLSHRLLGNILSESGDNQRALEAYETAIRLAPTEGILFCNRARIQNEMGDYRAAVADFDKAIELGYKEAETYTLRAQTRVYLKDFEGALADFDMAVEKAGKCPAWIDFARGLVYEKAGQPKKAEEHFRKAREADPSIDDDPPVL